MQLKSVTCLQNYYFLYGKYAFHWGEWVSISKPPGSLDKTPKGVFHRLLDYCKKKKKKQALWSTKVYNTYIFCPSRSFTPCYWQLKRILFLIFCESGPRSCFSIIWHPCCCDSMLQPYTPSKWRQKGAFPGPLGGRKALRNISVGLFPLARTQSNK